MINVLFKKIVLNNFIINSLIVIINTNTFI
jgi:hypothetical protein